MEEKNAVQINLEKSGRQDKASLRNLSVEQNKIETLEGEIKELVVQNNAFTMEIKDLYEKMSDLRISIKSLESNLKKEQLEKNQVRSDLAEYEIRLNTEKKVHTKQRKRLEDLINQKEKVRIKQKRRIVVLEKSSSFRIGQVLVKAFSKPGKNTLLFPFRLIGILSNAVFGKILKS